MKTYWVLVKITTRINDETITINIILHVCGWVDVQLKKDRPQSIVVVFNTL